MNPALSPTARELEASLLLEVLADLVLLAGLAVRKTYRGEDQPKLNVACLTEWAKAAVVLVNGPSGYSALDRQTAKIAAKRYLESCAKFPPKDDRLFEHAAGTLRVIGKVIGRISESEPYGVETEK